LCAAAAFAAAAAAATSLPPMMLLLYLLQLQLCLTAAVRKSRAFQSVHVHVAIS